MRIFRRTSRGERGSIYIDAITGILVVAILGIAILTLVSSTSRSQAALSRHLDDLVTSITDAARAMW